MNDFKLTRERLESFYHEEVENYLVHTRLESNTDKALKSVGHALLWACAIMEINENNMPNYKTIRDSDEAIGIVKGIRYARHRVVHQFLQLLTITPGAAFPMLLPAPFFEIRWLPLNELPKPDKGHEHKSKAEAYKIHLQNTPIRLTFDALNDFFNRVHNA